MSSSLLFTLKAATMSLPLLVKALKNLLHGISHRETILWSNSAILAPVCGDGNFSTMQIEWRLFSGVKTCTVTPRKDAVIPGFVQILAHINDCGFAQQQSNCFLLMFVYIADLLRNSFSMRYFTEFFTIN